MKLSLARLVWVSRTGCFGRSSSRSLNDRPCCYIDPKSDTYYNILTFLHTTKLGRSIWERYQDRIVFLNPLSTSDYLVSFNAIEPMAGFYHAHPDRIALLVTSLVAHIKRQLGWDLGMANRWRRS